MKTKINFFIFTVVAFTLFSIFTDFSSANANSEKNYYAKVQTSSAILYQTADTSEPLFVLPFSYFVKVEDIAGTNFFKASYHDVSGYVNKEDVSLMQGSPTNAYAEATFEVFSKTDLFFSPNTSSASIYSILNTDEKFVYYGKTTGEELKSENNTWYFCKSSSQNLTGYIYSGITDYLSPIQTNTEIFPTVSEEVFTTIPTNLTELSTGTQIILIVSISVPSVMILYFLTKPSKIVQATKKRTKQKSAIKKRHGDYFEFDESQL